MTQYTYPVVLKKENDTYLVSFPDFPEAHTFGESEEDALAHAVDALATIVDAYIVDRQKIPAPSTVKKHSVTLPLMMQTKVELYNAMREQKIGKAELARRLDVHLPQIDRLMNVHHSSRLDQIESAFGALGKRLVITVEDAERRLISGALARVRATTTSAAPMLGHRIGTPRRARTGLHRSARRPATAAGKHR